MPKTFNKKYEIQKRYLLELRLKAGCLKPKAVVQSMVVPICGVDSVQLKHWVLKLAMKYIFLFFFYKMK